MKIVQGLSLTDNIKDRTREVFNIKYDLTVLYTRFIMNARQLKLSCGSNAEWLTTLTFASLTLAESTSGRCCLIDG